MALDALVDSTQLDSDLTDVADAIRAKTGGTAPLAFPNEFISEIGNISGGMDLSTTYGSIVWESVNTIHIYGLRLPGGSLSYNGQITTMILEDTVNMFDGQPYNVSNLTTVIGGNGIETIYANSFLGCNKLDSPLNFPKCTSFAGTAGGWFRGCTKLTSVTIGSIGFGLTIQTQVTTAFQGYTQAGLLITIYCTGADVNDNLTKIRNGATNATITIKASENTMYNGNNFNAGDTILTST